MPDETPIDLSECELVYSDRDHDGPYDYHLVEFYEHADGAFVRVRETNHIDGDGPSRTVTQITAGEATTQIEAARAEASQRPPAGDDLPPASLSDTLTCVGLGAVFLLLVGGMIALIATRLGLN